MGVERIEKNELKRKIYSRIDELPTLPVVVPKLLRLMQDPNASVSEVTKSIASDQALTGKVLMVANSAYYGFSQEIASIDRAVALLGFNMVKSLALSIGVIRSLPSSASLGDYSQEGLWVHSLAVASALEDIGKKCCRPGKSDHLFIVGLLHDIGKVILIHFFTDLFRAAVGRVEEGIEPSYLQAERAVFGCDHAEVGGMLLERWRFPGQITEPIAAHHSEEIPQGASARDIAMLRIADALPKQIGLGGAGFPTASEVRAGDLALLGLSEETLEAIRASLTRAENEIKAFSSALE